MIKPVRKKKGSVKTPLKSPLKKKVSIDLKSSKRMRSSIDLMNDINVTAMKKEVQKKVMDPEVAKAFKAGHQLVLTKREEESLSSVSGPVTSTIPIPSTIKKLMRSVTLECTQKIFYEVSGDLVAIARDTSLPPIARGIARLALKFQRTGDLQILEGLNRMMGLMDKASSLDDSPEEMRDFLLGAMAKYEKDKEREDNIIDVGGV